MQNRVFASLLLLLILTAVKMPGQTAAGPAQWTFYITNDSCSDYTWGLTEEQTRQAVADLVHAHLDEMARTDGDKPENRDRYNLSVTQEAFCLFERYPARREELIRRVKEGRVYISPFLNNSLWAFQSAESFVRTLYPARRMEREWGLPLDVAEHIEEPALPWGSASLLAGCGVRWLLVPFLEYDTTFGKLTNPPLFEFEGPDGGRVRVVMDSSASKKANYVQGAAILKDQAAFLREWWPHYRDLAGYPLRAVLASGTHGDISSKSAAGAHRFASQIAEFNAQPGPHPVLVNAVLPQFTAAVDEAERRSPFLTRIHGCFGHSWDLWPVSLAKYAAAMRETERHYLAAEALLAVSGNEAAVTKTRALRERAEWNWTMLADHAWNGTDPANQAVNTGLRRKWSEDFAALSRELESEAWNGAGAQPNGRGFAFFNGLSFPRRALARVEASSGTVRGAQVVEEPDGRALYVALPRTEGYSFAAVPSGPAAAGGKRGTLRAAPLELESPLYKVRIDARTGGISSLIHKPTRTEVLVPGSGYTIGETIYHDGIEHRLEGVRTEVAASGPVLARLKISGTVAGASVVSYVTVYAELDRVDFDYRIKKQRSAREERLVQVFPIARPASTLNIDATGAVIRPSPQPEGDLLPGADARRFAVQGFVDASAPNGPGVTIAPLDAYALRQDLASLTFEALGDDQNFKEVAHDQGGVTEFQFRYSLYAHAGPYSEAEAVAWSADVASPPLSFAGSVPAPATALSLDPRRAIATALKPADDPSSGATVLRLREVGGRSGPATVSVKGYKSARRMDLLERPLEPLSVAGGAIALPLNGRGRAAVALMKE